MSTINSFLPLQLFGSGQLLCVTSDSPAGLILQQPHYADFIGLGAAVGGSFDIKCTSVYTLGDVKLWVPETYAQRQQAFQRRIAYITCLHKITFVQSSLQRAYLIVRQLCVWLGLEEAKAIPHELVGQLVGVLPTTVAIAWQQYLKDHHADQTISQRCQCQPVPAVGNRQAAIG